jgi:molecular chaperone Hsp33
MGERGAIDDVVQPFRLGRHVVRGRHVRLGAAVDTVLGQHAYPQTVSALLGELMALGALLASSIKFDGVFSIQTKGDGPVRMMVADITSAGAVRGYADFDRDGLAAAEAAAGEDSVPRLLGAGYLAFTVDQGPKTERYQGIVELAGATLSDCAHNYFRQSEQIETSIKLASAPVVGNGLRPGAAAGWRAGAIMLQRAPTDGGDETGSALDKALPLAEQNQVVAGGRLTAADRADEAEEAEEEWRRAVILMSSVKSAELLDPALPSDALLCRLFPEEAVWVYRPRPLAFGCRCSRQRVAATLRRLPRHEIEQLKVDGQVVVTCQFCNRSESFDTQQLDAVYAA